MSSQKQWDKRFLGMAMHVALWSKDPSRQVGAVIVDDRNRVRSLGFNGFPRGVEDTAERLEDRDTKLKLTVHAEINALAFSSLNQGGTLYVWPLPPCARCMSQIIQSGIRRVVSPEPEKDLWYDSCVLGRTVAEEAGLEVDWVP